MAEVSIGPADDFADPGRKVVEVDGVEVGVFRLAGAFTAYLNICPHQGGPVCQGKIIAKVDEDIAGDGRSRGLAFSKSRTNIVCPWHAYEFDIATGAHAGNAKVRLRAVAVKVEDGEVIVTLPDRARARPGGRGEARRPA